MEIIEITFPARRYHATPWDAHVNEGHVEWPPSPWRIARALLSVGYSKFGWGDEPSDVAKLVISKVAESTPAYALPSASESHTRHYMPTGDKPAKVFDAFLRFAMPDDRLLIGLDVNLTSDERKSLAELVNGLTYLGRAESWAEARLLSPDEADSLPDSIHWCAPNDRGDGRSVRLLTAMSASDYDSWRKEQVASTANAIEESERRKAEAKGKSLSASAVSKARSTPEAVYPKDILAALQLDTSTWQSQGWPMPPGSRWVNYCLSSSQLQQQPLTMTSVSPRADVCEAILLAIDGEGKQGTVRPLMKRALPLMELLHAESIRIATRDLSFGNLPELTGKADDGTVLRGHSHAHWLPISLFGLGRIDHVLVFRKQGFSRQAVATLSSIRWAYAKGIDRLSINLAGMGVISEMAAQLKEVNKGKSSNAAPIQCSCFWESETPLVLRKYVHRSGKKTPEGQIREELMQRNFDEPVNIRIWSPDEMVERNLKGYVLTRKPAKQQPPVVASWGVTIEFAKPQQGPICLGYASHFGLGLMRSI